MPDSKPLTKTPLEAGKISDGNPKKANSVDDKVVPIILLPGVMGSRLKLGNNAKWDPNSTTAMLSLSQKSPMAIRPLLAVSNWSAVMDQMDAGDLDKRVLPPKPTPKAAAVQLFGHDMGWAGVAADFYKPILVGLQLKFNDVPYQIGRHPIHAVGYDWRDDILKTAGTVADQVRAIRKRWGKEKVILVTHSMGGLVARAACMYGLEDDVKGVVHVVQPVNGAVTCYRRYVQGVDLDRARTWGVMDVAAAWALRGIMGNTRWGFTAIMSGMIGPNQLLPNDLFTGWLTLSDKSAVDYAKIYDLYKGDTKESLMPKMTNAELAHDGFCDLDPASSGLARDLSDFQKEHPDDTNGAQQLRYLLAIAQSAFISNNWPTFKNDLKTAVDKSKALYDKLKDYAHPRTFMLYAGDLTTDSAYDWSRPADQRAQVLPNQGDGTVAVVSARGLDAAVKKKWDKQAPPANLDLDLSKNTGAQEHAAVFADSGVCDLVVKRVQVLLNLP